MENAFALRRQAETAERAGRYAEAADFYRREAAVYRKNGDLNGAKVEEMKADRWRSEIRLFRDAPEIPIQTSRKLSKFEPIYGCYIGAFLDRDERLGAPFTDENFQSHYLPSELGQRTGKMHATAFCYVSYGRPFPSRWARILHSRKVAPHIAWEPNQGLSVVQNDAYLERFAQAAGRTGEPIFLRYASEMNGDWTRYGGNPAEYRRKWMIVADVMRRYAPNVAMVWCVNSIPEPPIASYYPGDDYVDWTGINFYSVPFHDNRVERTGTAENPADLLSFVYENYAHRKPMMVCEYGASHFASADRRLRTEWAAAKIKTIYAALPRLFPRVKAINIFDNDNIKYAEAGRQLNNYSVTDDETVLRAYSEAIRPDYFLSAIGENAKTPVIRLISHTDNEIGRGVLRLSAWARCYAENFTVEYLLNGKPVGQSAEHGTRSLGIAVERGNHLLVGQIRDNRGRIAARTELRLRAL